MMVIEMDVIRGWAIACAALAAIALLQEVDAASGLYDGRSSGGPASRRLQRMDPEAGLTCTARGNCIGEGPVGAMWLGPRLGRRRRSDVKPSTRKIEALMGEMFLGAPTWNVHPAAAAAGAGSSSGAGGASSGSSADDAISGDKRLETTFVPRLGRAYEAEVDADLDDGDNDDDRGDEASAINDDASLHELLVRGLLGLIEHLRRAGQQTMDAEEENGISALHQGLASGTIRFRPRLGRSARLPLAGPRLELRKLLRKLRLK